MAETKTVTPDNGWIKCSERLPDFGKYVLVFYKYGDMEYVEIGKLDAIRGYQSSEGTKTSTDWSDKEHNNLEPTHWQPLPEPPTV